MLKWWKMANEKNSDGNSNGANGQSDDLTSEADFNTVVLERQGKGPDTEPPQEAIEDSAYVVNTEEPQRLTVPPAAQLDSNIMPMGMDKRAGNTFNCLEAAVEAALSNDLRIDEYEATAIKDAMRRTNECPERVVAVVAENAFRLYNEIVTRNPDDRAQRREAAVNALWGIIEATKLFPDETYGKNNAFKVVKTARLFGNDLVMDAGLDAEYKRFEQVYKDEGLDRKLVGLTHPNFSNKIGMHFSLIDALLRIYHTVSDDMSLSDDEIAHIQQVYETSPITKYDLVWGMTTILKDMIPEVEAMIDYNPEEKANFKMCAVQSAIDLREKIRQKESDKSRENQIDTLIYDFGVEEGHEELVAKYRKGFSREDHLHLLIDYIEEIVDDLKIDPWEYKTFCRTIEALDIPFEEALGYAAEILVEDLRKLHKKEGEKYALRRRADSADVITYMIMYRLGELPSKDNPMTKKEYDMLGKLVHRVLNYQKSQIDMDNEISSDPKQKSQQEYIPEWCRKRFTISKIEHEGQETTLEKIIQDGIKKYNIVTSMTGLDFAYAVNLLEQKGLVKYNGQELYAHEGLRIAVVEILAGTNGDKKCYVRIGEGAYVIPDKETGIVGLSLGKYRVLKVGERLSKFEQGYRMEIDPSKPNQRTLLFVPHSITEKPAEERKEDQIQLGYCPLDLNINPTFEMIGKRTEMKSAVKIIGTESKRIDIDDLIGYQRTIERLLKMKGKDPAKVPRVRIDHEALMKAQAIYIPMFTVSEQEANANITRKYQMTSYDGVAVIEPQPLGKIRKEEDGRILIPIKSAFIIKGGEYDIKKAADSDLTGQLHSGSVDTENPTMYLVLNTNPAQEKAQGASLKFIDAMGIRLNYLPEAVYTGNRPTINVQECNTVTHIKKR